jgi:hypothetical protein
VQFIIFSKSFIINLHQQKAQNQLLDFSYKTMTLPMDALTVVADSAKVGELTDPAQPVSTA